MYNFKTIRETALRNIRRKRKMEKLAEAVGLTDLRGFYSAEEVADYVLHETKNGNMEYADKAGGKKALLETLATARKAL